MAEYLEKYLKVHGKNGHIGFLFLLGSLCFDIFKDQADSYPVAFFKGIPNSGKGTMAKSLGAFFGGVTAGLLAENFDKNAVFLFAFIMFLLWFLVAFSMKTPASYKTITVSLGELNSGRAGDYATQLLGVRGVADVIVVAEEGLAYLQIDKATFEEKDLKSLCSQFN